MPTPTILSATPEDAAEEQKPVTSILSAEPVSDEESKPAFVYDEQTDSHIGVSPDMNENDVEYAVKTKLHGRSPDEFVGGVDVTPPTEHKSMVEMAKENAAAVLTSPLSVLKGAGRFATYDLPQSVATLLENAVRSGAFRPAAMKEAGVDRSVWGPVAERQAEAIKNLQTKHAEMMQRTGILAPAATPVEQVATDFGAGVGQVGVQIGMGMVSGAPIVMGTLVGGGLTMADQISKARAAGETPEDAFGKSLLPTAVVGVLEGIGNGAMVKAISKNVRVGTFISNLAASMRARPLLNTGLIGAAQESVQNVATDTWERLNRWDDDTVGEIFGASVYSGLIGFLTMGAVGHIAIRQTKEALSKNPAFNDLEPAQQDALIAHIMAEVENNTDGILDEATDVVAKQADPGLIGYDSPLAIGYDKHVQQTIEDTKSDLPQITDTPTEQVMKNSDDGVEHKAIKYRKQAIKAEVEDVNRQIIGLENDYARAVDPATRAQVSVARNVSRIDASLAKLEETYKTLKVIKPEVVDAANLAANKATYNDPTLTEEQVLEQRKKVTGLIKELQASRQKGTLSEKAGALAAIADEIMAFARQDIRGAKTAAGLRDTQVRDLISQLKSEMGALKQDRNLLKSLDTAPNAKLAHSLDKKIADLKRRRNLLAREEALLTLSEHWEQENPAVQMTLEQFKADKLAEFNKKLQAFRDGYRKGMKVGGKEMMQSIAAVQEEFTKFLTDNVPKQYAWKMIRKIKDANTPARMERLTTKIQNQIDKMDKKILFADIKKLAAGLKKSKTIDVGYLNEINTILAQVGITHPKTLQGRLTVLKDSVIAKMTAGVPADLQHVVLQNLWNMTEKHVTEMSFGELSALKSSLEALAEEGRSEQRKHQAMLQAYKDEFMRVFSALGQKPLNTATVIKQLPPDIIFSKLSKVEQFKLIFEQKRAQVMNIPGQMKEWLHRLDMSMMPIMVVGDMFDRGMAYYNGPHTEYIIRPMQQGFSRFLADSYRINEGAKQLGQRLKLKQDNFIRIGIFSALKQEGGLEKVMGSGYGQEIQFETEKHLRTPEGKKMVELFAKQFGMDAETALDAIIAKAQELDVQKLLNLGLMPEEQQFYDYIQTEFARVFPVLQETARVYHNLELNKINNYFRFDFDFEGTRDWQLQERFAEATGTIMPNETAQVKKTKANRDMLKERKGGTNAIRLDAFEVFTKYINDAYYYIHMTPYLEGAKAIIHSKEYIRDVGDIPREYMTDWLDTVARKGGQEGDQHMQWLDAARHNGYLALLAWRLSTAAIQTTSMIVAMADVDPTHMSRGIGTMFVRTPQNTKIKKWLGEQFPTYLARSLDDPSILDNFNQSTIDHVMNGRFSPMSMIKQMDKLSAGAVLLSAYRQYFTMNNLPMPTIDEMVANPKDVNAAKYAEEIMAKTQGSPFFINLPLMLARGKGFGFNKKSGTNQRSLAKAWFMLQTYNMMVPWRLMRYDAIGAGLKRRDPVQGGRVLGALLLAAMGAQGIRMMNQALTQSLTRQTPPDPDEEDFWDGYWGRVFMDVVKTIPFVGDAASMAIHQKMNNVMLSTLWEAGGNVQKWHQAEANNKTTDNEDTIDKNKLRIRKAQTDVLLSGAEWLTPGAGAWRILLNEQIKEILLDKYDTAIDNVTEDDDTEE